MICSNCRAENRPNARFCKRCGGWLLAECPFCGAALPDAALYCDQCGHPLNAPALASTPPDFTPKSQNIKTPLPLSAPTSPSPVANLHQYIPPELLAKLENARSSGAMEGERRIVTMLFCDVKGSTWAAGQLDPEEWTEIINGAFEQMIRPVYRYEGTVARLMGDAILAFFGAPIAHEDDPQRAILAGLEIIAGIGLYRAQVQQRWGVDFDVRVGVNTGLVVVGAVGSDLRMEYTAMGEAINLAARMEQTAQPGTLQIAEETYRLVAPLFHVEPLGELEIKGHSAPLHTYRVVGVKAQPGRLRGIHGVSAPIIGRQRELTLLKTVVAGVGEGSGQIVTIIGEAGLGKSRLVAEISTIWRAEFQNRERDASSPFPRFCESQGVSYDTHHAYLQFQQQIRCLIGATDADTPPVVRQKLAAFMTALPLAHQEAALTAFSRLLALGDAHEATAPASPEGESFRGELFHALYHTWQAWTQQGPAICVFDDLHWADPASVEFLLRLLPLVETQPLLILCAFRPDRQAPGWQVKTFAETNLAHRYTEIALRPLDAEQGQALVDRLLGAVLGEDETVSGAVTGTILAEPQLLPPSLRALVSQRADGNPFFAEEIVRSLIDHGVLEQADNHNGWRVNSEIDLSRLAVPDNLQALLVARIDRLEEETRHVLQLAAVIGRRFFRRVLALLTGAVERLDGQLLTLERAELIREAARHPELEYIFRHSLTQEATYATILLRRRREFHRQVGEAIETLFSDRLEEFYSVLAHHFGQAGDPRALHYDTLAADAAFRLYAITEALAHYTRALNAANRVDAPTDLLIHLHLRYGRCKELQDDYGGAQEIYAALAALAKERDDRVMELAALQAQATAYTIPTRFQDVARARRLIAQALDLARHLDDQAAQARILWTDLILHLYSGSAQEGIPAGEQSVILARKLGLHELLAHVLQDLALVYMGAGRLREGRAVLAEAKPLWQELGNLAMLAENHGHACYSHIISGDLPAAIAFADEAMQIAMRIDNRWGQVNSHAFVALAHLALGENDDVWRKTKFGIEAGDEVGHPAYVLNRIWRSALHENLEDHAGALALAEEGDRVAEHFIPFRPLSLAHLARVLLRQGRVDEAIAQRAQCFLHGDTQTLFVIDVWIGLFDVELALAQRRIDDAHAHAIRLISWLTDLNAIYFLPEAQRLYAKILGELGQTSEAIQALEEGLAMAQRMGARHPTWLMLIELARLEKERGNDEASQALLDESCTLREWVVAHSTLVESGIGVKSAV